MAVAGAILVTATILIRMQRTKSPRLAIQKLPVQIDVSLQAIRFTESRHGVKQWDLTADRAEYDKNKGRTSLARVNLTILNSSAGEIRVTADRADYDHASKNVSLSGNVQGKSASGLHFTAPQVRYVAARSTLESPEKVNFRGEGLTMEGVGMEWHTKSHKLKLSKVEAEVQPEGARR
ncbi:LPS export ABC transporter periplasmic protein LptC [Geomonas sp. RF6]|uniref:LPS export ABC transporter periplasmic protein LptC n=1 Tax=Geomonas sp. RF6 TaxID=2897342 RepID=UPI001E303EE6|nr:LPS export ABC transporter periplasmic protein LptC [Geomonas sp. RF6]UFS68654.1 LPS export ABC transporter periplasmic protein LptC [Geomonas sp. RF6]